MNSIIADLREVQGDRTLEQFAKDLGLKSGSTLTNIYQGTRGIGTRVLRALYQYPDTRDIALSFLSENVADEKQTLRLS